MALDASKGKKGYDRKMPGVNCFDNFLRLTSPAVCRAVKTYVMR